MGNSADEGRAPGRPWLLGLALVLLCLAVPACQGDYLPAPTSGKPSTGYADCATFVKRVDTYARVNSALGWILGFAGIALMVVGGAIGPSAADSASWAGRNRNMLIAAGGGLLIASALGLIQRSDTGSVVAARATMALAKPSPEAAYNECLQAQAEWLQGRKEANSLLLNELHKRAQEAEEVLHRTQSAMTDAGVARDRGIVDHH